MTDARHLRRQDALTQRQAREDAQDAIGDVPSLVHQARELLAYARQYGFHVDAVCRLLT